MKPLIFFCILLASCGPHLINGLTMKEAVILNYPTLEEAQAFENKVIKQLYPNHEIVGRLLVRKGRYRYHQFVLRKNNAQEFFYFDVTKYYGRI